MSSINSIIDTIECNNRYQIPESSTESSNEQLINDDSQVTKTLNNRATIQRAVIDTVKTIRDAAA